MTRSRETPPEAVPERMAELTMEQHNEPPTRIPARQRAHELRILNAVAEVLNSALDVREALQRTLALVADLLGLETGWVWLLDPESQHFYNAAAQHLPPYLQEPVRMTGYSCWCIQAFQRGKLTPGNIDVLECSRLRPAVQAQAVDVTHGLRYHASIPLYFRDTPLGIMNVTSPAWRELTRDELRLLSTIAKQVGIAIERARLAEESTRLARAEERARIAREIHDTLAQGLTAIALHIEGGINQLERDPSRARERLEQALAVCRANLVEARRSVLDLRTVPLAGTSVVEALGAMGRAFAAETGIRVGVHAEADLHLPLRIEAELFRIVQEALANARRHAHATEVTITVRASGPRVQLVVRDDGRGFNARSSHEGRYGLLGMRERARLLGGTLRIEGRAGRGTAVRVTVPLPQEEIRG
jgi:two-component system NarL family sensor kinase